MASNRRALLPSLALLFAAFVIRRTGAQADECDHDYYYVNLGDTYSGGDNAANIACIDAAGCSSIIYVQAGCNGCFDPACVEGVSKFNTSAILGEVVSVDGATAFTSGGISNGDLVCSTGQLSVASRVGTNLVQAHEWSRASLAGTKFVYATSRGNVARCEIYSFEGATVTITVAGTPQTPFGVGAFAVSSQGTFNAQNSPLEISSDNNIIVGCYEGNIDYTNVYPVHTGRIYGHDSTNTLGFNVDCNTLDTQLPSSVPSCEDANQATVATNVQSGNQYYTITANNANLYAGVGMTCTPSSGHCIAVTTTADSDGSEGTMWVPDSYLSDFFVLPFNTQRFAVIGEAATTSCQILDGVGGTVLETLTMLGTSSNVRYAYSSTLRNQGSVITCTGGNVAIIASFNQEEYNLGGRESASVWTYAAGLSTCAPTSNPTSSPTFEPTTLPSASPSRQPTSLPTDSPSRSPSQLPTSSPTFLPSASPSINPTTAEPTNEPSASPTLGPSVSPTTSEPTGQPSVSPTTSEPTASPSAQPTTPQPTNTGVTNEPTVSPSTSEPTASPSSQPTFEPTTLEPTSSPTPGGGTNNPTVSPTTSEPTSSPSQEPTSSPTSPIPTASPSTTAPSVSPTTTAPSVSPSTSEPTVPTVSPSSAPTTPTAPPDDGLAVALAASLSSIALLLSAGLLIFFVRRRRKRKREEYEEILKQDRQMRHSKFEMSMESFI